MEYEVCATSEADFEENTSQLIVVLNSFIRPAEMRSKETHFSTDWLPPKQAVHETVSHAEALELARDIFQHWVHRVRDSIQPAPPLTLTASFKHPPVCKDKLAVEQAVESVIESHPFLGGLRPKQLRVLAENAMRMHYEPGELIFREGDPADRFYLIENGKVALESFRKNELAIPIQIIGHGDVLGWSWLFPPYHWHFDARALERTAVIFFYGTALLEHCFVDHDLGYELMKRMATIVVQRLQSARQELLAEYRRNPRVPASCQILP